jgi:hypothetical protein
MAYGSSAAPDAEAKGVLREVLPDKAFIDAAANQRPMLSCVKSTM